MRSPVRRPWVPASALALGLVLVALAPGASAVSPTAGLDDPISRLESVTLPNGLQVLTIEDHTTPVVSLQIWVKAGAKDELAYTGIAHLFEHMMFKGSLNLEPERHAQLVEARGGRVNAFTNNDVTVYFEDFTADALPLVLELEAERFRHLDISAETLASERQVVIEERRLRTDDSPQGRVFEALLSLVWQAHPYRSPVIGWRSDIENVTLEACRAFFETYYAANNIVLVLAGDFDTATARALVARTFGKLRTAEEIPRRQTREPAQYGERRAVVEFEVRSPILAGGWHAPPAGHPDAEALDVAGEILSTGRSSRLYRRLVDREQAALYAQGGYWELQQAGVFFAMAGVRPGKSIEAVEDSFMAEIARLRTAPVSEAELAKAKTQLEVGLVSGLRTAHALASRVGRETVTFGRVRSLEERLEAIRKVTAADVQRVARRYLRDDQRSVVHLVPPPPDRAPEGAPKAERGGAAEGERS